jgi:hypothetical protein
MDKDGNKTGGRKKGVLNKSTQDIKELASEYGPAVITELARLAIEAVNEQTRVAACKEILDRIYGKASQVIEHGGKHGSPIELTNVTTREQASRPAFVLARADLQLNS